MGSDDGPPTADGGTLAGQAALWRCESCGQVLGIRVGRLMHLSLAVAVDVEMALRVRCGGCYGWQRWGRDELRGERRDGRGELKSLG